MGIYDREYYRGETRGSSLFSTGPVCKGLIAVNVAIFVLERLDLGGHGFLLREFAATSYGVFHQGKVWQLLTYAFLHADHLHLLGNMYFLWVFGRELEAMYGVKDFLVFYLSAAVVAGLGWTLYDFTKHSELYVPMIGASGAVCAVVVLYALFYPRRELLFLFVIPIEVWLLVSIYFGYQVMTLLSTRETATAVETHLAGAAFGYLFKHFDLRWSRLTAGWTRSRRPRLRIVPAEPREASGPRPSSGSTWTSNVAISPKPVAAAVVTEEQLDAKLDEVLAKIAKEGPTALTDDENRVLQEASRRARNRRSDRP